MLSLKNLPFILGALVFGTTYAANAGEWMLCKGGYGMNADMYSSSGNTVIRATFQKAQYAATSKPVAFGHCAFVSRNMRKDDPNRLEYRTHKAHVPEWKITGITPISNEKNQKGDVSSAKAKESKGKSYAEMVKSSTTASSKTTSRIKYKRVEGGPQHTKQDIRNLDYVLKGITGARQFYIQVVKKKDYLQVVSVGKP